MPAPTHSPDHLEYRTSGGIWVARSAERVEPSSAIAEIARRLDAERGALFTSNYEYPGRYNRWSRGFVNPPLVLEGRGRAFALRALNARGQQLLAMCGPVLARTEAVIDLITAEDALTGAVATPSGRFSEEERSKQPSIFSVVRALLTCFGSTDDHALALDGAFGYDLAFQFDPLTLHMERPEHQRDLVLYLPDEITVIDHAADSAIRYRYDFAAGSRSTSGLARDGAIEPYVAGAMPQQARDHEPGAYASSVDVAKDAFRRGDLFEVVLSQQFFRPCADNPSTIFARLQRQNPAPFGGLVNLGNQEYLISGSPEMYVRVTGRRIETCPIAGTAARGTDVFEDAQAAIELLNSAKAESELTMCTDVDRNDKSRICEPGSVKVIGRRQIEFYSRVIHTVDHVEGTLREGFDGIDAFLSHMWAVTVTGAPKLWAMRFIEERERSPRRWYAGALGSLLCDGNVNTGLVIRTVHVEAGVADIRTGNTLLIDSVPADEERETEVKAAAFLDAVVPPQRADVPATSGAVSSDDAAPIAVDCSVLLFDCEDSFVHTLASYLREAGAQVTTIRAPIDESDFRRLVDERRPDLVFLSPGPGRPEEFAVQRTIDLAIEHELPVFGVCLGLQGIVERFGGTLGTLEHPMHGKPSTIEHHGGTALEGLPSVFTAGRYHSLFADRETLPSELRITAESDDGVIMAIEHERLPISAVQFHPESIMSAEGAVGMQLIRNLVRRYGRPRVQA